MSSINSLGLTSPSQAASMQSATEVYRKYADESARQDTEIPRHQMMSHSGFEGENAHYDGFAVEHVNKMLF